MRRNTRVVASAGLIPVPREVRAVCQGRKVLDALKGVSFYDGARDFQGALDVDGAITVCWHPWRDGCPPYPLAALRNLVEVRRSHYLRRPTGGLLYGHYLDGVTGEWGKLQPISGGGALRRRVGCRLEDYSYAIELRAFPCQRLH